MRKVDFRVVGVLSGHTIRRALPDAVAGCLRGAFLGACLLSLSCSHATLREPESAPAGRLVPQVGSPVEERLLELVERQGALEARLRGQGEASEWSAIKEEAEAMADEYETFVRQHPEKIESYVLYGKFLRAIGEDERAHLMFMNADQRDRGMAVVKQQLANYYAETGKFEESVYYIQEALELSPDVAVYHYQYGLLLHTYREEFVKSGMMLETQLDATMLAEFKKASRLDPENRDLRFRYAESFYDLSSPRWEGALAAWDSFRSYYGDRIDDSGAVPKSGSAGDEPPEALLEISAVRLHRARVLIKLGRYGEARSLINSVKSPSLAYTKYKLLDELP